MKIKVILGSTREGRFSEKPGKWITEELAKIPEVEAELLDLREYPMPFYDSAETADTMNKKYPHEVVQRWSDKIDEADAYVVVTPEYNHGYPAVLKNAFDHLYPEWANKPIGFISYGTVAGARSVEQLRLVAIQLQMAPILANIAIQQFRTLVDEQGNFKTESLEKAKNNFIAKLLWWTKALKQAREETVK